MIALNSLMTWNTKTNLDKIVGISINDRTDVNADNEFPKLLKEILQEHDHKFLKRIQAFV